MFEKEDFAQKCRCVAVTWSLRGKAYYEFSTVKTFPKRLIFIRVPCSGIQFRSSLCFERDDLISMT